jgi:hypothetical protein
MNLSAVTQTLEAPNIRPDEIADERVAEVFRILLLLLEELCEKNEKLKEENQKLREAINLLKGEQAKPDTKPSRKKPNEDISSEEERKSQKTSKKKKSKAKKRKIKIDPIEVCKVDQNILPDDAELGARAQVRKRDVSLHTMTEDGTKADDTFLTISQTAKKLGVCAYEYIYD